MTTSQNSKLAIKSWNSPSESSFSLRDWLLVKYITSFLAFSEHKLFRKKHGTPLCGF